MENILGANKPLHGNRANFNLGHWINILWGAQRGWEEGFVKL